MKNQKGFIPIVIVLTVLIIISLFYLLSTSQSNVVAKPTVINTISTPKPSSESVNIKNNIKARCVNEGYEWVDEFNECESPILTPEFCQKEGGKLYECESPCRHSAQDFCSEVCMVVCKFK